MIPCNGNCPLAAHRLFRGASELTKIVRHFAFWLEFCAALVAALGALEVKPLGPWTPLVLVMLMAGSTALRIWSRRTQSYSERCRRLSARAYAAGDDSIGVVLLSELRADAPVGAERFGLRLPAATLDEYYEATKDPGLPRLREVYAHSAFYSWRLLRRTGVCLVILAVAVFCVGAAAIYGLAVEPPESTAAERILDFVCSFVLVGLSCRALDAGVEACSAASESRAVAQGLIEQADPGQVSELCVRYDMERSSGPPVPTIIYKRSRGALQEEWHERRKALDEQSERRPLGPVG